MRRNTCDRKDCNNEGTERRDFTITGIGDIRYYCAEHIIQVDAEHAVVDAEREVGYAQSLMDKALRDYKNASDQLADAQKKLFAKNLDLMRIKNETER